MAALVAWTLISRVNHLIGLQMQLFAAVTRVHSNTNLHSNALAFSCYDIFSVRQYKCYIILQDYVRNRSIYEKSS